MNFTLTLSAIEMKNISLLTTFVILFSAFSFSDVRAQSPGAIDTAVADNNSILVLPIVYFTPETRWAGGVAVVDLFTMGGKSEKPTAQSSIQLGLIVTQEKQFLAYAPYQLFTPGNKYNIYGEVGYYVYSYLYFGEGNNSTPENPDIYEVNFPRININAVTRVGKNWNAGLVFGYERHDITSLERAPMLASLRPNGVDGGTVLGLGPLIRYDSRDDVYYPHSGINFEAKTITSLGRGAVNSVLPYYGFTRFTANFSNFTDLKKYGVLAINAFTENLAGDVPFFLSAFMGGPNRFRGYYFGRFRGNHFNVLAAEYRFPIVTRLKGTVFAQSGNLASTLPEVLNAPLKNAAGAGIRFQLTKKSNLHVRVDYAITNEGGGFYFTFGEAF
jgi:hypothetical protein